jgi:hypothetical protein
MTQQELRDALRELNVRPDAYCLDGETANEAYVLERQGTTWFVYYSERGKKTGEKQFPSEGDACQYMFQVVTHDSSTKSSLAKPEDGPGSGKRG